MKFPIQFMSKRSRMIAVGGIATTIIGLVLAVLIFGLTFGTVGIIVVGMMLFVYGATFIEVKSGKIRLIFLLLRRLIFVGIIIGCVSFIYIEGRIFQSMKSNDDVDVKYAVVLGAGIDGEKPSLTLKRRLDSGIKFLEEHPSAKLVVSGGFGSGLRISEAEVMKRYLIERGINEGRILKEEKSATSDENLNYTQVLLRDRDGDQLQDIVIITSDYHMFRAKVIASRYFSRVYGISSDTPLSIMINYSVREYLAVLKLLSLEIIKM